MRFSIVFLALCALAAAIPTTPKLHAADQDFLKKQQDVIYLLENIAGTLPYQTYYDMGYNYELDKHYDMYDNPSVVRYYYGLWKTGQIQPMGLPYSYSVSQLRKEVALLTQVLMGAKDYPTFLATAAWARVHVNQEQFVTAFSNAVIQLPYMYGVVLPAPYEIFPHYFFDSKIIQKVQDFVNKYGYEVQSGKSEHGVYNIYVNYTSHLPWGEHKIAYLTEDIGLNAYYSYVQLAMYMMPYGPYAQKYEGGEHAKYHKIGHGAHYYYIHQQLLARYNLERLSQGLDPIRELDYYYEHLTTPYNPHFRYMNGMSLPNRGDHVYITSKHHHYELVKLIRQMERRILDAIQSGYVMTPQSAFMNLYQPQGYDILGSLIEGTGRSVNPRYYGSFMYVARQLLGNAPEFYNIYEYTPSALELGYTAMRDPMFYQLYNKIMEFFHYYQEALPAYHYNDIVVPGVNIEKVEFTDLITYFSDYEVSLDNAVVQPAGLHQEHQPMPHVKAHLKRLDHKQYEYTIYVQAKKVVPGAVVRVYVGPKYNFVGEPIDINEYRHWFYEIDQFMYDITEGQNVITRNSHQATGQSYDLPSIQQLKDRVQGAVHSQNPYYINYPEQLFGFPSRLTLPKGHKSGLPLQVFVIITAGVAHQQEYYGPVTEQQWMTYQPHHYQVVGTDEYEQYHTAPVDKYNGGYQTIEVIPDYEGMPIVEGFYHYGYLYNKYPTSYYYPNWRYYNQKYYHEKYPEHQGELHHEYPAQHVTKGPFAYAQVYQHQEMAHAQPVYKQGSYMGYTPQHMPQYPHHEQYPHGENSHVPYHGPVNTGYRSEYLGSGHYPGQTGYQGTYPAGTYPGYKGHDEYLHNYYENKYIGDIIGGAVSLDGKPLGYPFDRPLGYSAFYAHNVYVKDIQVYHNDDYFYQY